MRSLQKIIPLGGLDKDNTCEYLREGDYVNAKNIRHITTDTASGQAHIPIKGNKFVFSLPDITTQRKVWRFYTEQKNDIAELSFLHPNGNIFGTIYYNNSTSTSFPILLNRNTTIFSQYAFLITAFQNFTFISFSYVVTDATPLAEKGYIDMWFNAIPAIDWVLSAIIQGTTTSIQTAITQESYDISLIGKPQIIGGSDLLGDVYLFSAPPKRDPITLEVTITGIAMNTNPVSIPDYIVYPTATGVYELTTDVPHGLTSGEEFIISCPLQQQLNGTWVADVVSPTQVILTSYYSNFLPHTPPIKATFLRNQRCIGEIGVAEKDINTDIWNYTRLLRSKEWNFWTKKQPDIYVERNAEKDSIYWTDNYNVPRVMYYEKPFITDGAIKAINPKGTYHYSTIADETRLLLANPNTKITFSQQYQSGGHLASGNWRYSFRFLTNELVGTEWSDLTNPINVFTSDTNGNPLNIIGDAPNKKTSKINELKITGIPAGCFEYIELAGINYVGDAVEGYIISRIPLNSTSTSILLTHSGNETDIRNLDLSTLSTKNISIATAKNISVIDKRMVLSNLTLSQQKDLTSWAQQFKHNISYEVIPSTALPNGSPISGEYQLPINVNNYVGYMYNETYRIGVKVKMRDSGLWTDAFWVDDIKIDCSPNINAGNPTLPTRRTGGLPNFNMTIVGTYPLDILIQIAYINFAINNTILDFEIDGKKVKDIISAISFVRAECKPQVLASGYIVPSCNHGIIYINPDGVNFCYGNSADVYGEFPFISGRSAGGEPPPYNLLYDSLPPPIPDYIGGRNRKIAAFYSPDIEWKKQGISSSLGDKILCFGNPVFNSFANAGFDSNYGIWSGRTNTDNTHLPVVIDIAETTMMVTGQIEHKFTSTKIYRKICAFRTIPDFYSVNTIAGSLVVETGGSPQQDFNIVTTTPTQEDRGFYFAQYYRPMADPYGKKENTTYISTGHIIEISSRSAPTTTALFGGDTFTQRCYFRHRMFSKTGVVFADLPPPANPTGNEAWGGGISFYCQNRVNMQMRYSNDETIKLYPDPSITLANWLKQQLPDATERYNTGYTIRNQVLEDTAYDSNIKYNTNLPCRIMWSALKPQDSPQDRYRIILPLNFCDLDISYGEITHHGNFNGELVTWQPQKLMRQFFNTRGTLQISAAEVVIGSGDVMSRDGQTLNRYGSSHKWSIIKGVSMAGGDVYYWINIEAKKVLRLGYDGTISLADIRGMQSFFANDLKWIEGKDNPVDDEGICGIFDTRYAEVLWTIRGKNPLIPYWNINDHYPPGQIVFFSSDYFNPMGDVYEAIQDNTGQQPDLYPLLWKKLIDDGLYSNNYTIIFHEYKNKFTAFRTPVPRIYIKHKDGFINPHPITTSINEIYEHDKGDFLIWFNNIMGRQEERGFIEMVCNKDADNTKWYEALQINSDIVPVKIEFETKQHKSYLNESEIETREDAHYSPIKEDSTIYPISNPLGLNDNNTSLLYGKWLKIKVFFEIGIAQKLLNLICKMRISSRRTNS